MRTWVRYSAKPKSLDRNSIISASTDHYSSVEDTSIILDKNKLFFRLFKKISKVLISGLNYKFYKLLQKCILVLLFIESPFFY